MKKYILIVFLVALICQEGLHAQKYSRIDSLRGSITKERAWWDLLHYDIDVSIDIHQKSVSGKNIIKYQVLEKYQTIQIDLQSPMHIDKIIQEKEVLKYTKEKDAYFIKLKNNQIVGSVQYIEIHFSGSPEESYNPPWDGGFTWAKDKNQQDFIANSNQALGSSLWLPSKDHPFDEPDEGMDILITGPDHMTSVSNGRLIEKTINNDRTKTFHWKVVNPINGYGINISMGDYDHYSEKYQGESGSLNCDYYVLSYNLKKAKKQFNQVPKMLEAFEHWFGPYPFYEDGFKLVEVPYLGMEHQSSVTYGNGYENGYLGGDLSSTGWGLKFDFIIIHEAGHEWFANNITNKDVADMWIHEGFTTYSEVLYLDYHFGKNAGNEYLIGYREKTRNDRPLIGTYGVDQVGSTDMYIKGAAMIHMLRQIVNDDTKFRDLLRGMNLDFRHSTVSSTEIENYIMEKIALDLHGFFNQYLRSTKIPRLQYRIKKDAISYRWRNTVDNFNIPVKVFIDKKEHWIEPSSQWQELKVASTKSTFEIDANFFIDASK